MYIDVFKDQNSTQEKAATFYLWIVIGVFLLVDVDAIDEGAPTHYVILLTMVMHAKKK